MIIPMNTPVRMAFLLVDHELNPLPGETVNARVSVNGQPFTSLVSPVEEIGNGWYFVDFTGFGVTGPVIFLAKGENSMEWRDVHYVNKSQDVANAVREELEKWAAELTLPIKLIRTGSTN